MIAAPSILLHGSHGSVVSFMRGQVLFWEMTPPHHVIYQSRAEHLFLLVPLHEIYVIVMTG